MQVPEAFVPGFRFANQVPLFLRCAANPIAT